MTSVNGPNGERGQCPTTTRRPAAVPSPAMNPSKRSIIRRVYPTGLARARYRGVVVASLPAVIRRSPDGMTGDPDLPIGAEVCAGVIRAGTGFDPGSPPIGMLQHVLERSPFGVLACDERGVVRSTNPV